MVGWVVGPLLAEMQDRVSLNPQSGSHTTGLQTAEFTSKNKQEPSNSTGKYYERTLCNPDL